MLPLVYGSMFDRFLWPGGVFRRRTVNFCCTNAPEFLYLKPTYSGHNLKLHEKLIFLTQNTHISWCGPGLWPVVPIT
jgi:hypothetical protein